MDNINLSKLSVLYTPSGGEHWTGGLTYQKNLIVVLSQFAPFVKFYILTSNPETIDIKYNNCRIVNLDSRKNKIIKLINRITLKIFDFDYLLSRAIKGIKNANIDLIFPGRFRVGSKIAVLYWIPDFQHLHLPEMYDSKQINSLSKKFKRGIKTATLIVLSSENAKRDLENFAPEYSSKARVMNFVAHIPEDFYKNDPQTILKKYNLPEKFFYLPNQFWKHKNHSIVLEALKILKEKNIRPFFVFTGNTNDSRNPSFFAELMRKISEYNLREQIAILGLIPHNDVYRLMRQSICILNPSFFEGWSTTVEEAKSVGKRLILSDIEVHREQNPPEVEYFKPDNPYELSKILESNWMKLSSGPDAFLEKKAQEIYPQRMKLFAKRFLQIAKEAIYIKRGKIE